MIEVSTAAALQEIMRFFTVQHVFSTELIVKCLWCNPLVVCKSKQVRADAP